MTRSTELWRGKTDDTPIPPRVRLRQFERDKGRCQCGCGILIRAGDAWQTDHTIAIANGGVNAEDNLRTLLTAHHKIKTRADVAEKAITYRKRAKHLGIKLRKGPKIQSRGFARTEPQRTASRPIQRRAP